MPPIVHDRRQPGASSVALLPDVALLADYQKQRPEFDGSVINATETARRRTCGPLVLAVQRLLNALGHGPIAEDGRFGSGTEAGVMRMQRALGVTADGRVGPNTRAALRRDAESKGMRGPGTPGLRLAPCSSGGSGGHNHSQGGSAGSPTGGPAGASAGGADGGGGSLIDWALANPWIAVVGGVGLVVLLRGSPSGKRAWR